MHKYAEQQAILGAMTKIANANGYQLTPQVAGVIAYWHQYSPVLIMKTAGDIEAPVPQLLDVQTLPGRGNQLSYRLDYAEPKVPGYPLPGYNPYVDSPPHAGLINMLGTGLGGVIGAGLGAVATPYGPGIPIGAGLGAGLGLLAGSRYNKYRQNVDLASDHRWNLISDLYGTAQEDHMDAIVRALASGQITPEQIRAEGAAYKQPGMDISSYNYMFDPKSGLGRGTYDLMASLG